MDITPQTHKAMLREIEQELENALRDTNSDIAEWQFQFNFIPSAYNENMLNGRLERFDNLMRLINYVHALDESLVKGE